MKKFAYPFLLLVITLFFSSCGSRWQQLYNGENLDNWDKHLGTFLSGAENAGVGATTDNVFSVVEKDGEKLIRISGVVNGSLATRDTFSNYHLQLVFKWGDSIYTKQNSGLLYHSFGDFGEALEARLAATQARLDALPADELLALQHASIVGPVFWNQALAELGHDPEKDKGAGPRSNSAAGALR